jgi:hypothetical protein
MVASALLALAVASVVSLWEADFLFFSRHRYEAMQRAHIASGFTLYGEYPEDVLSCLEADSTMVLYDSVPRSRIKISREPWGLYEKVTITAYDGKTRVSKILGKRRPCEDDFVLYCRGRNSAITLTGKTRLKGRVCLPRSGVIYGQMGSVFFDGEKLTAGMMSASEPELPEPDPDALAVVAKLKTLAAEDVVIGSSDSLPRDTIIVGRKVCVERGFRGSVQLFATDSLHVEDGVTLDYPSGLFSEKYIEIKDSSVVNGYVIVHPADEPDARYANYVQSRTATVRGLLYIGGSAQLQGIVSGVVLLDRAVYYSPRGYYDNMICDATILPNREMAWPLWLSGPPERKEAKWVN